MRDMTIQEFCDRHVACRDSQELALANCKTMADVWATAKPELIVWVATRSGVLTDRELRLFAVWSARQVQHLMADPRSIATLGVAERHARGDATDFELAAARESAGEAVEAAAGETWKVLPALPALAAASEGAREVAWLAALQASAASAASAALEAARPASEADGADGPAWEAWVAAAEAAGKAQSDWLRANTKPNFSMREER